MGEREQENYLLGVQSHQHRSWSDLPAELLDLILKRLVGDMVGDRESVLFGCVCKSWGSVAADRKQQFMANKHPYIIFISNHPTPDCFFLFSASDRRMYKRTLPSNLIGRTLVGSSCGYLLLKDQQHCRDSQLWLLHPFTGHELHFPSPRNRYCSRFILASSPSKNKFVVIALSTVFPFLQLYKYGSSSTAGDDHGRPHNWLIPNSDDWVVDAAVFKGKIYILTGDGVIGVLNIQLDQREDYDRNSDHIADDHDRHHHQGIGIHIEMLPVPRISKYAFHLVASEEQLFQVDCDDQRLRGIYELDFSRMEWVKLNSFGKDEAFFLGHTKSNPGFVSKLRNFFPSSDNATTTTFCLYQLPSMEVFLKFHAINGERKCVKISHEELRRTGFWYFTHQAFSAD